MEGTITFESKVEEAIDSSLYKGYSMQLKEELLPFVKFVCMQKPKTFIEIGYGRGETLDVLTKLLPDTKFVEVTFPLTRFGMTGILAGHSWTWKEKTLIPFFNFLPTFIVAPLLPFLKKNLCGIYIYTKLKHSKQFKNTHLLLLDSHKQETVEECAKLIHKADFVFIDGDHSYESILSDFNLFYPIVSEGGHMAFHDVAGEADGRRAWKTISSKCGSTACFFAGVKPKGIGVIQKKGM